MRLSSFICVRIRSCQEQFVSFRNKSRDQRRCFLRVIGRHKSCSNVSAKFLFRTDKEISICQKMEASTKEQTQLLEHRQEPEPQLHFHKPHTITVRRFLTPPAQPKTTCRIRFRSSATNSKNFRTQISASSQRTLKIMRDRNQARRY